LAKAVVDLLDPVALPGIPPDDRGPIDRGRGGLLVVVEERLILAAQSHFRRDVSNIFRIFFDDLDGLCLSAGSVLMPFPVPFGLFIGVPGPRDLTCVVIYLPLAKGATASSLKDRISGVS